MTKKQLACAESLRKALDRCHKAGLRGGVYEYSLRVWPSKGIQPHDAKPESRFFEVVEEVGFSISSKMLLDGGSGS